MRRRLSVVLKILLLVGLAAVLIISELDRGIGMAIFLTVLKATHLEVVLGFVAVGGIFVTQILPHIWPVFLIVVVGSALIFVARRRAGRDGLTHRPTLLNKED